MLKLKSITKDYKVADMTVRALKGIDLCFRKNEFVSILGPSGCGKTTLLNIIGGLDKYTTGDLFIGGTSTKEFTDRNWDVYRNHRIGFIFQSYNLIPHQTVLGNVELALTIAGISKSERIEKAKKALDRVGLAGQYNKRPNQLSGGQCQRVAIARALVNEPEILLADEPTGALDTETSVQIMNLIKEIASERLVIMVTHNPDLAIKYSTRIVNLLDGEVLKDSNPFSEEDEAKEMEEVKASEQARIDSEYALIDKNDKKAVKAFNKNINAKERAKMSFWTAFKLSARNLWSKRGRNILVGFAGAIGIIGVSAVLAVSQGVSDYIVSMQDQLLAGNPVAITKSGVDFETLLNSTTFQTRANATKMAAENGKINVSSTIDYLIQNEKALDSLTFQNDFDQNYVSYIMSMPKEYYNVISMRYGMNVNYNVYADFKVSHDTNNKDYELKKAFDKKISLDAINQTYAKSLIEILKAMGYDANKASSYSDLITGLTNPLSQSIPFSNEDYIKEQYQLVAGRYPKDETGDPNKKEILLVLDTDETVSDLFLAQLGYYSQEEFFDLIYNALNEAHPDETKIAHNEVKKRFTEEELLGKTFTWYPNDNVFEATYTGNKITGFNYSYVDSEATIPNKSGKIDLQVTGVIKLKEGNQYGALTSGGISSGFLYSEATAKEMIKRNINSNMNKYIKAKIEEQSGDINKDAVTSVLTYDLDYYWESVDNDTKAIKAFGDTGKTKDTATLVIGTSDQTSSITSLFLSGSSLAGYDLDSMFTGLDRLDPVLAAMGFSQVQIEGLKTQIKEGIKEGITNAFSSIGQGKKIYLRTFGGTYLPNSIRIYPVNFNQKDKVTGYLDDWNKIDGADAKPVTFNTYNEDFTEITGTKTLEANSPERKEIRYTDTVGIIITLINTMINIVTYALVAFTALSLVVSTVMIAIITYVSVMERIKEIGVIRSLGGRKKDVSHLFNAETFIIGFVSGIIGLAVTYVIQIIANIIIRIVSGGVVNRIANLTPLTAGIMLLVSILLTSISGLLPARSAAKKDPVVALRTE